MLESSSFKELNKNKAIIFTALKLEYLAVREHLQNPKEFTHNNKNFEIGTFLTDICEWDVLIFQTGVGNSEAAHITTLAIAEFDPDIVIFSGIGGGLKDAKVKDVVMATDVFNFESQKITQSETLARPKSRSICPEIDQIVQYIDSFFQSSNFEIFKGPIVSGEKVLAARDIDEVNFIRTHYNNAIALDMEGWGFAYSAFSSSKPFALIRSISDELKDKNPERDEKNQPIAAANAAIIAFEILKRFKPIQRMGASKPVILTEKISINIDDSKYPGVSSQTDSSLNLGILNEEIPISSEYHKELDTIKELLLKFQSSSALDQLNALYNRIIGENLMIVKYRIFSYKGSGFLQLRKLKDAGRAFVEAYGYNPSEEKAQINAAYGYFLLGEYELGAALIRKVLTQNPVNAVANSVLIYIRSVNEDLEKIITEIPNHILETPEVAMVVGSIYYSKKEFSRSEKWLRIGYDNEKNPNMSSILASSIINSIKSDKSTLHGRQINKKTENKLREAETLFSEALELVKSDLELQKKYTFCLIERGFIRQLLNEKEKGFDDIIFAYSINPDDPSTILHRALIDMEQGKNRQAEVLLKKIILDEATPNAIFVYLDALKRQQKYSEAVSCISCIEQMFDEKKITSLQKRILKINKVDINIERGKDFFENAETDARNLFEENTNDIESRLIYGKTLRRIKKLELAKEVLSKIESQDIEKAGSDLALEIADEYFVLGHFKEAAEIYEKFIDPSILSNYTARYIESLYHFEKLRKVLDTCRKLHANGYISKPTATREILICGEIGDLIAAKTVCKQYVQSFPDDLSMRYNLAVTNFALQNFEETDQFLQQTFSPKICGLEIGTGISRMYMERHQFRKALELAYDLRREFFDMPEAHENYISVFLNLEKSLPQFEDIQKVQVDSAVYFKNNDNGDEFVFVIESREDLSPRLREKSINDPFIEKIIGKEKGESIPIIGGKAENENIEITDILNKYVYAFRESFNDYNKNFPDSSAVKKIQIKSDSDEKITEESIKKMFELVHQNYDYKQNVLNLYLEKKVPISAIAAKFKINSYDLFPQFSSSPDVGIFSFYGNNNDIFFASNQLAAGKKIILDFSSIFTIFSLKLEDLIIDTFGKPVITQSLLDELNSILINLQKPLNRSEHGYLTPKDGRIVMETISSEQIDAEAQKIRKLLEWIKNNCDIVPCYPLLNLTQFEIEKYKFMGKVALDSIYLSSDNAYILFTDDKILSSITKWECGSNCISIQDILCYLHLMGKISEEQHVNLLLQLFEMNYYYIQFSLLSDSRFSVS